VLRTYGDKFDFEVPFILRQGSSCHQSPELRHGPDADTTSPRTPCKYMRSGCSSRSSTRTGCGGRITRSAVRVARVSDFLTSAHSFRVVCFVHWQQQSGSLGNSPAGGYPPILRCPNPFSTNFARRAMVTSSFPGPARWAQTSRLRYSRPGGIRGHVNFLNRSCRRVALQLQPQQFQQRLCMRMGTGSVNTFS